MVYPLARAPSGSADSTGLRPLPPTRKKKTVHPDDFHARAARRGNRWGELQLRADLNGAPTPFETFARHIFWNSSTMQRSKTRRGMKVGPKFTPGTPKRTPRGPRRAKMEPEITPRGSQGRPRVSSGEPARLPGTPERARRGPRSTPGHDSGAEGNLLNPQNEALASMGAMFCKNDHIGKLFQQ